MWRVLCALLLSSTVLFAAEQANNEEIARKAVEAERNGDFAGAISAFQQLLRNGADSPELRNNLGIAYFQLRDYGSALQQFQNALARNPSSIPGNLFSGLSLVKLQRPKQALPYLEKARRAQPGDVSTLLALAQAEVASGNIAQARASFEEATRLDPQNAEAWYGLGITNRVLAEKQLKQSRTAAKTSMDASERAIGKAMQLDPNSVRARMILGECFRIAERYDLAVREYKAATEQQPALASAWAGLAAAYSASGDDLNALKAASKALELDPSDASTEALVAGTYLRQADYAKAKPFAIRALKTRPDLANAHVVLAKIYLAERQPEKALPELEAAAKQDSDGSTYYLLATTLRQLGRRDEAGEAMAKYKQLHRVER